MKDSAMKYRWLVMLVVSFSVNANADFCTPENGQAWYLLSGDLARKAKTCRNGIYEDDDIEACRPFTKKNEQTRTISSYAQECYEQQRTRSGGFGYSQKRMKEVDDNMNAVAAALEMMRKFQAQSN